MNTQTPIRSFKPTYVSKPLVSTDIAKIRKHYGLQCTGKNNENLKLIMTFISQCFSKTCSD